MAADSEQLKRIIELSEARASLKEKQYDEAIANIAKTEADFERNNNDLKFELMSSYSQEYDGPDDDILSLIRWIEERTNEEKRLRTEMEEVYINIFPKDNLC